MAVIVAASVWGLAIVGFGLSPAPWLALPMLALAGAAHAHQYWLAASDYAPAPGDVVEIRASAGTSFRGEAKPWSPERCAHRAA